MFHLKYIENINNNYKNLYNYSNELYKLISIQILFNYVYYNTLCKKNYKYDFQKETFIDIIFNIQDYKELSTNRYGFLFEHIIINNLLKIKKPNTKKLIITNFSTILYNYGIDFKQHKNTEKTDTILFPNNDYTDEINKKRIMKYKNIPALGNIYSTHAKNDYIAFLKNILNGNDLNNATPVAGSKYDFISCHYNYIYGLNQTASIRGILELPQYISTIAVALKYLERDGELIIFATIANTRIPSYRKLVGLLAHSFRQVELVSNDINQNILIGVPEFYFKCSGFKANISSGLLEALIQCGIDTINNVYNVCDVMDWLDSYIEHNPEQTLFYKYPVASASTIKQSMQSEKRVSSKSKSSGIKSLRLSKFLASGGKSTSDKNKQIIKKASKKVSSRQYSKSEKSVKFLSELYYIDDINIPELNAILENDDVSFRVMVLCNQIETLFIGFFDMVNYHIENSIEYDKKGVPRVSDFAIKQKTVSNLRRLLDFLEYNRLPYNRHALAVLQEKQDDLLDSFYNLHAPIESKIIRYTDLSTKQLDKHGWENMTLGDEYHLDSIESHFKRMGRAYKVQRLLLDKLGLDKLPAKVQYATEDMTRGLAKFINKRYSTSLPYPVISNAFIKMWECLSSFNIIPKQKTKYRVFHICEAPGQMILATQYFVEKKRKGIADYDWRANSLNPFNAEVRSTYGKVFTDEYGLMRVNPKKWIWGGDGTGDITRVANIRWYREYIRKEMPDLNLIIGDGGLSSGNDTLVLQRLDLAQVVMVLACSRKSGGCIIKHFTPYMPNHPDSRNATSFFIGFIYLYYLAFAEVSLFKPYSSDMTSGEFYVVGRDFRGLGDNEENIIKKIYQILEKFQVNQCLFSKEDIPESFKMQVEGFIKQMSDYNVMGYEKTNLVLTCYNEKERNSRHKKSLSFSRHTTKKHTKHTKNTKNTKTMDKMEKMEKMEKILKCNDFLQEDKIEEILVPRYNKWIKLYEFE